MANTHIYDSTILNKLSDNNVMDCLVKYNYSEVSTQQLAEHIGFSDEDQRMLSMFWEPAFNKGWIYLSDEIILEQMTNENSKDSLTNFYKQVLRTNDYVEEVDYKKINKDDNLVKNYESSGSFSKTNQKNKIKQTTKKYYAVTGETYKDLLQKSANKKGKTTRKYYRKVEQLAIFMKDYIVALHSYLMKKQLDEQKKLIEEKDAIIEKKDSNLNCLNTVNLELLTFKKLNEKNESIYIVATYRYATQGIFKVGRTKCMKTRISGHNNTHITGDKVKVLKEFKVNDSVATENYIHRKLKGLLVHNEKEFFVCPFDLLENIIQSMITNDESHNNLINSVIDTVYQLKCSNYSPERWMTGIDMSCFREEYQLILNSDNPEIQAIFDITIATEEQKKAFVNQCIQSYKNIITEPNQLIWKTFQAYLITQLQIPKYRFKSLQWKPMFNEATIV